MYNQAKSQYGTAQLTGQLTGACQDLPAAPTRQVEGQLDSVNFALDGLQETVSNLIRRLEPVTGGYPDSDCKDACAGSPLVPVAARISFIHSRVNDLHQRLLQALNALEI